MDYQLSREEFEQLSRLIYDQSGITLRDGKQELVRARLSGRLREGNFRSFRQYYDYVRRDPSGEELSCLLDTISTNVTSFFRQPEHFQYLREEVFPRLLARKPPSNRIVRVWSAGCSSGEEPYSIAVSILEAMGALPALDARVLATDISRSMLSKAARGIYPMRSVAGIDAAVLARHFQRGTGKCEGWVRVKPHLKDLVEFRYANLMTRPPVSGPLDVIFCRNVMIYFDFETQERLVGMMHGLLAPGGHLFLGHSETLTRSKTRFTYCKPAVYRKSNSPGS